MNPEEVEMKQFVIGTLFSLILSTPGVAQDLGLACEASGSDHHTWKYVFEIDQQTNKGVQRGVTYGGTAYSKDIEVVFTPERMQIRALGAAEFEGYVDRSNLSFYFGGASGSCKKTPVTKRDNKF
jgi:hypothetical protein